MGKSYNMEEVKDSVRWDLPLLSEIQDEALREKVVEAWALSLTQNGCGCLEDVPRGGRPEGAEFGTLSGHLMGVAKMACAIADIIGEASGRELVVNRDILLAGGLCHDLGNPYEFNAPNRPQWVSDSRESGFPALRHTFYGAHIALTVGLPEAVAHICACHAGEGDMVKRSVAAQILHYLDQAYWHILENAFNWKIQWNK